MTKQITRDTLLKYYNSIQRMNHEQSIDSLYFLNRNQDFLNANKKVIDETLDKIRALQNKFYEKKDGQIVFTENNLPQLKDGLTMDDFTAQYADMVRQTVTITL